MPKRSLFIVVGAIGLWLAIPIHHVHAATISLGIEKQPIRGFGGMNCPEWVGDLTAAQADRAFGNGAGQLGLTILRLKVPNDKTQFSRELPTALRAKEQGAIIMASPWSPPASMKGNNNLVAGSLNPASYSAYAAHLKSFVDYMAQNGAPLYAISIQNEPNIKVDYESCDWTSAQLISFLKTAASGIGNIKLIAPEAFDFSRSFTDPILNDAEAAAKLSIIGGHIYGSGLADYPLARNKGKDVWMTEHLVNDTNWPGALATAKEINDSMAANFNAYIWWYIRRSYGPIDENGNVTKRGYVMSQFSKFIRPGYVRVDATGATNVDVTAYKNGGDVVIVAVNRNSSASTQQFNIAGTTVTSFSKYTTSASKDVALDGTVAVSGGSFSSTLDASSVTTFVGTRIGGGSGGASGNGGTSGSGGASGSGGTYGSGGAPGSGGALGSGGTADAGADRTSGSGGRIDAAADRTGGSGGTTDAAADRIGGSGGVSGTGGAVASGSGGASSQADAGMPHQVNDAGCQCNTARRADQWPVLLGLAGVVLAFRRRR